LTGCLDGRMAAHREAPRVVSASREIAAGAGRIFELIARHNEPVLPNRGCCLVMLPL
jgi:hypothetical protein